MYFSAFLKIKFYLHIIQLNCDKTRIVQYITRYNVWLLMYLLKMQITHVDYALMLKIEDRHRKLRNKYL